MSVHYKFKSSLDFDTVTFDGLHISVTDLKKAIMQQKKIGKSADFDLQITNAQTKEVYDDDETLVPKNTSVIVARVPVSTSGKKTWERGDIQVPSQDIDPGSHVRFDKLAKTADLANAVASEEDKIKAMMTQSSQEYDISKYVKSRSMTGPLPANYTCYRCGKPGHWIKNCPTNNLEIKRSTGIPRSFMVPVDGPEHKGALLTSTGDFAVPLIDHQAYKEVKKEKPPFLKEPEPEPDPEPNIPEDLLCMLCRDLLQDAVLIPCCGNSFCDECIRTHLLDSENHECPECHETDISPDTMIPSRFLRNGVMKFKNETGYIRMKALHPPLNEIKTSTHTSPTSIPLPIPDTAICIANTITSVGDVNTASTIASVSSASTDAAISAVNTVAAHNTESTVAAINTASNVAVETFTTITTATTATITTTTTLTASPAMVNINTDPDNIGTALSAATAAVCSITTTTTTAATTITTTANATITPSTITSSVDCHESVSSIVESTSSPIIAPVQGTVSTPIIIVVTAASVTNTSSIVHSPYSSPAPSPASICNIGSTIGALSISAPITTPPSSPHDIVKESADENDKVEEIEKKPTCHDIISKSEDFNSSEEVQNHTTENTLEIELDDNQPGTPLADEPPMDLETEIPLETKLPIDTLQGSMGSPYDSSIAIDAHNDSSMSPTRDSTSGNSIATITTRGPLYMLSGLGFGRTQQNSRQYSARSNASHETSYGSSRASRSSRTGYGTPPRERYRQARRSEHSNYKSSYGGYGSQTSSHHMPRNYQPGTTTAPPTLSSHGSQTRYGTQVQSHRVNIPPGYMTQNIQRPHAPLTGMPPNYSVQPPPAKHYERTEETGRGILPLPHRVSNETPYKRKLNSSPLEIHGQASIPSQPPPPGVAPVLLSTPQPHGSIFPYPHDEFYHESRRLKDRSIVGDALDDFARQLLEYSREQQRRPSSRHCSRSRSSSASHSYNSLKSSGWSHSGSRSGSHSSSRSRSRSFSSRSRSPSYRRSRSRSRSRSFSRSSHSRSRSVSRSRSRSRGRNSSPRKRSNSKSNSPKNFIRYVPRSPYHQKKDYSTAFFNPPYHPPYTGTVPHPGLPLDHFPERNRYYRDQYRPYDEYHNTYNSPRYEQHDQRYDPKYIQEYPRFDSVQHRTRTREIEKYERGRSRDVSRRRENVSKPISEKPKETEVKESTESHSKTRKKEEKLKHRKHHHKNKEGRKEVKQDENKKKEQVDIIDKTDVTSSQTKKASEDTDTNKKNVVGHDNKEKKHKHKRRKENEEAKKKKKSRELTRIAAGAASEKPIKSKKKKAKKEIGKIKVDKLEMQETAPDKPTESSLHIEVSELTEQSPSAREIIIPTDEIGLEEDNVNVTNPSIVLEEPLNEVNTPCVSTDEQPLEEGENQDSPKGILEEDNEIKKEDYEELEQPLADGEDEIDDGLNPEMTDDGEVMAEKVDSDEGVLHSDDANVPEISFELPEISKWEREEFDEGEDGSSNSDSGNLQEMKASLPSDIIQRAEKAILQKPLKDAIIGPPTSRDKHRSLENKKISEKPLRSGESSRDSVVVVVNVKEKESKSKEQGIEKEINIKDKPEEDSLQITISAEKNKRSVQTKSKSVKKEKLVDNSQTKKLKLDRSKFSDQLKNESLVSYADSSDNVATEKLYSSDSSKEFSSKSEPISRKKENIVITKKEKERKCNIENEIEKTRSEESSKRVRRSIKKSPSSKAKAISSNPSYPKHEIIDDYSEIKIPSKLESYNEHDSDKRMSHGRKYRTEGRTRRRETSHILKEQKIPSVHSRELYRESEQHSTTKQVIKRKPERSRSRSYDSNQSLGKGQRSRNQIKHEDRKRTKRRSPTHNSNSERKRLSQETELFNNRIDTTQMNFDNRTLKESFLITRSRKESTQDESNFEPNYDETSDSDNSSEAEDSKRRPKHHSERRAKKFEPVAAIPKIDETEFENIRVQEGAIRGECSNERLLKKRDRSNSTESSSGSSQTESVSSGTERSSKKRLRSNSPDSDTKHRHRKSKHKKHKKHRHKHKRKKSHKYKQR